ncbi:hypothetical protein [Legionella gresilensis]|uniref:hypothetical protein n=1 Tax=Legionella gresilensis TaxID=91823 RepID=UPI001040FEB2|nr:hypothetical protein [Legionella gresilensis]
MISEAEVIKILQDPEEFKGVVKNNNDLRSIAEAYPNYANALVGVILSNPDEFNRLIQDSFELLHVAEGLPASARNNLINFVLNNTKEFERLFKDYYDLQMFAKALPDQANTLIDAVLISPEKFNHLFENDETSLFLAKGTFRQFIDLLGNREYIAAAEVVAKSAEEYRDQANKLVDVILNNPSECERLIKDNFELIHVIETLPDSTRDKLVNFILNNPQEFERLFKNYYDLHMFVQALPDQAHTLINHALINLAKFKHLFKDNDGSLFVAKGAFSQVAKILGNKNLAEAEGVVAKRENRAEIAKNARLIGQISRGFFNIPEPLQVQIASATGDRKIHSEEESDKIASQHLGKPKT